MTSVPEGETFPPTDYVSGLERLQNSGVLLGLVKTPLQLLNVLELADWAGVPPERRALMISPLTLANKAAQIRNGIAPGEWAHVFDGNELLADEPASLPLLGALPRKLRSGLASVERTVGLRRLATRFASHLPEGWLERLTLAHGKPVDHFPQALRQSLGVPQVYVDDGIGAVEFSRARLRNVFRLAYRLGVEVPTSQKKWDRSLAWALQRHLREIAHWALFRPNPNTSVPSDHFTAFKVVSRPPERVEYNTYSLLRSRFPPSDEGPDFGVFIGQPHVRQGRVSFEHYVGGVRLAMALAPTGLRWRYLIHPEDDECYGTAIGDALGIQTTRGKVCVEFDLPNQGVLPTVIASYNSSALATLALLLGDEASYLALRFPPEAAGQDWYERSFSFFDELNAAALGRIRIVDVAIDVLEQYCKKL